MSYSFWRPQPWRPGALAPPLPPSYATAACLSLSLSVSLFISVYYYFSVYISYKYPATHYMLLNCIF